MRNNGKSSRKNKSSIRRKFQIKKRKHKKITIPLGSGVMPRQSVNTLGDLTLNTGRMPETLREPIPSEKIVKEEPELEKSKSVIQQSLLKVKDEEKKTLPREESVKESLKKSLKESVKEPVKEPTEPEKETTPLIKEPDNQSSFHSIVEPTKKQIIKNSFQPEELTPEPEKRSYGSLGRLSYESPKVDQSHF